MNTAYHATGIVCCTIPLVQKTFAAVLYTMIIEERTMAFAQRTMLIVQDAMAFVQRTIPIAHYTMPFVRRTTLFVLRTTLFVSNIKTIIYKKKQSKHLIKGIWFITGKIFSFTVFPIIPLTVLHFPLFLFCTVSESGEALAVKYYKKT